MSGAPRLAGEAPQSPQEARNPLAGIGTTQAASGAPAGSERVVGVPLTPATTGSRVLFVALTSAPIAPDALALAVLCVSTYESHIPRLADGVTPADSIPGTLYCDWIGTDTGPEVAWVTEHNLLHPGMVDLDGPTEPQDVVTPMTTYCRTWLGGEGTTRDLSEYGVMTNVLIDMGYAARNAH